MRAPADLYGRYAHLYDDGHAEQFADLFTDDGVFAVAGREPVRGRAAIARAARRGRDALPGVRHLVSSVAVETAADGATASGRAYVQAVQIGDTSVLLVTLGIYDDRFVRDGDGSWRIAEHRFTALTSSGLRGATLAEAAPSRW
ncbi:nuclear transport factor 2 family protein [Pseudonocardia endophytica]|uniref:SnoaL-like protein n=1 Tax=Pseudonocardia endophytica TaxID=401976 RepID=A0A4R1HIG8_PSEEN|nr:nuclear transport factor 2 family protein [Pseudonocardia endophytica]TCK22047.1 SnoaL-like protein [Pseudonocardia endophytica]